MASFNAKVVFVNPFYQEGVGRRTGINLKKNVRKDSDGFENFDDYWSESENDATLNATNLADKENNRSAANLKTDQQLFARKKSSLAPMPAFSPQVTSSEREQSHVQSIEPANQDVSMETEAASMHDADITGSVIKGPSSSLEPSSAVCKFKTRQRLSFSLRDSDEMSEEEQEAATNKEDECQSTDYEASQESSASSEGTVKAPSGPSSQSEGSPNDGEEVEADEEDDEDNDQDTEVHLKYPNQVGAQADTSESSSGLEETVSSTQDTVEKQPRRSTRQSIKLASQKEDSQDIPLATQSEGSLSTEQSTKEEEEHTSDLPQEKNVTKAGQRSRCSIKSADVDLSAKEVEEPADDIQQEKNATKAGQRTRRSYKSSEVHMSAEEVEEHTELSSQEANTIKARKKTRRSGKSTDVQLTRQSVEKVEEHAKSTIQEKNATTAGQRTRRSVRSGAQKKDDLPPTEKDGEDVEQSKSVVLEKNAGQGGRRKSKRQSVKGKPRESVGEVNQSRDPETDSVPPQQKTLVGRRKSSQVQKDVEMDHEEPEKIQTRRRSSKAPRKSKGTSDGPTADTQLVEISDKESETQVTCETHQEKAIQKEQTRRRSSKPARKSKVADDVPATDKQQEIVQESSDQESESQECATARKGGDNAVVDEVSQSAREIQENMEEHVDKTSAAKKKSEAAEQKSNDKTVEKKQGLDDTQENESEDEDADFFLSLKTTKQVPNMTFDLDDNDEDDFQICDVDSQEWGATDEAEHSTVADNVPNKRGRKTKRRKSEEKDTSVQENELVLSPVEVTVEENNDSKYDEAKSKKGRTKKEKMKPVKSNTRKAKSEKQQTSSDAESSEGQKVETMSTGNQINRKRKSSQSSRSESDSPSEVHEKRKRGNRKGSKEERKTKGRNSRIPQRKGSATSSETDEIPNETEEAVKKVDVHSSDMDRPGNVSRKMTEYDSYEISSRTHRRSSVHFTTKDMISPDGDISVHRVGSSEEDDRDGMRLPTTPAVTRGQKSKTNIRQSNKSGAHDASGSDHATSESERDESGQEHPVEMAEEEMMEDNRHQKKEKSKGKKKKAGHSRKRRSEGATSESSSTGDESGPSGTKRSKDGKARQKRSSDSDSQHASSDENNAVDQGEQIVMNFLDDYENGSTFNGSGKRLTPLTKVPKPEGLSASMGSILKTSKSWQKKDKGKGKSKKYSLLFTEKPTAKAYIIPPEEEEGVRRTRRQRIRPLEYWRNERAVYERRKSGGFALSGVLSPEQVDVTKHEKQRKRPQKVKGQLPSTPSNISIHQSPPHGTQPVKETSIAVVNPETEQEVIIDAVATSKMLKFIGPSGKPAEPEDPITISKAFSQRAFSAGILNVRPLEEKGSQLVRRDTMVFFVVRGKVAISLHKTSHMLQNGDWFFVPKGNVYNIKNLRRDEAKLAFFQLKGS